MRYAGPVSTPAAPPETPTDTQPVTPPDTHAQTVFVELPEDLAEADAGAAPDAGAATVPAAAPEPAALPLPRPRARRRSAASVVAPAPAAPAVTVAPEPDADVPIEPLPPGAFIAHVVASDPEAEAALPPQSRADLAAYRARAAGPPREPGPTHAQPLRHALTRALDRVGTEAASGVDMIADRVVSAGVAGDWRAIEMIADRIEGRPAQSVTVTHEGPTRTPAMLLAEILELDAQTGLLAELGVSVRSLERVVATVPASAPELSHALTAETPPKTGQ